MVTQANIPNPWAEATGTSVDPGATKKDLGWVQERPPFEYMNWWMNEKDNLLNQMLVSGVIWVADVAEMITTDIAIGSYVHTLKYAAANDDSSGSAMYEVKAPATVDEFGDHTLNNTNVAILQTIGDIRVDQYGVSVGNTVANNDLGLDAMKVALPNGSEITFGLGNYNISQFQWPNKIWHMRGMSKGNTTDVGTRITGDGTGTTVWGMVTSQLASGSTLSDIQIQAADGTTDIAIQFGCADGNMHLNNIFCNPRQGADPFTAGGIGLSIVDGNTNTVTSVTAYGSTIGVDINPTGVQRVFQTLLTNVTGASVGLLTGTAMNVRGDLGACDDLLLFDCTANGGNKALVISSDVVRIKVTDFWEEATGGTSPVALLDNGIDSTFTSCKNWRSIGGGSTVTYGADANVYNCTSDAGETVNQFNRDVTVNRDLDVGDLIKVPDSRLMPSAETDKSLLYIDSVRKQLSARHSDGGIANYVDVNTNTSTALNDISSVVNTVGKYQGRSAFNVTAGKPVYATGSSAASVWNDAVGAPTNTPI